MNRIPSVGESISTNRRASVWCRTREYTREYTHPTLASPLSHQLLLLAEIVRGVRLAQIGVERPAEELKGGRREQVA